MTLSYLFILKVCTLDWWMECVQFPVDVLVKIEDILQRTVDGMSAEGSPYVGMNATGPKSLAQNANCCSNVLSHTMSPPHSQVCCTLVLCSPKMARRYSSSTVGSETPSAR